MTTTTARHTRIRQRRGREIKATMPGKADQDAHLCW